MMLGLGLLTVLLVCGCTSPDSPLRDVDRDYLATYDVSSGQGGVKVRWTPAATRGQGRPSVGAEIDFKRVVEPMDFVR